MSCHALNVNTGLRCSPRATFRREWWVRGEDVARIELESRGSRGQIRTAEHQSVAECVGNDDLGNKVRHESIRT
jgi:hypothetical protein